MRLASPRDEGFPLDAKLHRKFKLTQLFGSGHALHLRMVRSDVAILRVEHARFERIVIGEQQQAFAVGVKPTDGIDV